MQIYANDVLGVTPEGGIRENGVYKNIHPSEIKPLKALVCNYGEGPLTTL